MTQFETETCSRCHGSGHYSYCADYGTTCFRCRGTGKTLTKRGAAARRYFESLLEVPMHELRIGDKISVLSVTNTGHSFRYVATITDISREQTESTFISNGIVENYYAMIVTHKHEKYGVGSTSAKDTCKFRVYHLDDDQRMKAALEYQETLTKTGKIKRK